MDNPDTSDAQAPEAAAAPMPSRVAQTVRAWFDDHIANSPVSRSVEAINHLTEKLPLLVKSLEGKV